MSLLGILKQSFDAMKKINSIIVSCLAPLILYLPCYIRTFQAFLALAPFSTGKRIRRDVHLILKNVRSLVDTERAKRVKYRQLDHLAVEHGQNSAQRRNSTPGAPLHLDTGCSQHQSKVPIMRSSPADSLRNDCERTTEMTCFGSAYP
jgi:hypothetical protein